MINRIVADNSLVQLLVQQTNKGIKLRNVWFHLFWSVFFSIRKNMAVGILDSLFGMVRVVCDFAAVEDVDDDDFPESPDFESNSSQLSQFMRKERALRHIPEEYLGPLDEYEGTYLFRIGDIVNAKVHGVQYSNLRVMDVEDDLALFQVETGNSSTNSTFKTCKWVWVDFQNLEIVKAFSRPRANIQKNQTQQSFSDAKGSFVQGTTARTRISTVTSFADSVDSDETISGIVSFPGLVNFGVSCYQNSVLQILTHSLGFQQVYQLKTVVEKHNKPVLTHFLETLNALEQPIMPGDASIPIQPKQLFRAISKYSSKNGFVQFTANQQHDAHEFLLFLLNLLTNDTPSEHGFYFKVDKQYSCMVCKSKSADKSDIHHILSLSLPKRLPGSCSLQQAFKTSFKSAATVSRTCSKCASGSSRMKERLEQPGRLVALHLQRYQNANMTQKLELNDALVSIPLTFHEFDAMNSSFSLYAVLIRKEVFPPSPSKGHYFSVIKTRFDDRWFKFDDEEVEEVSTAYLSTKAIRKGVYMLFYVADAAPRLQSL